MTYELFLGYSPFGDNICVFHVKTEQRIDVIFLHIYN